MLIFLRHRLTFLATPKTGTTAVELALRPRAEIIFARNRKHLTAQRYRRKVAPFLAQTFGVSPETVAVMRDPVEQIRSWFRYRHAARLDGTEFSARDMSFDDFVLAVIAEDPPPPARIGSQLGFLSSGRDTLLVDHLFAYENQPQFRTFMAERLKTEVTFEPRNVSPDRAAPLSAEVESRLREARAAEFALYDRLREAGGHLQTPQEH